MKLKLKYISIALLLFFTSEVFSQQLPLFSQYKNNAFLLNPSIAGHDGYTSVNLTARKQWMGFTDAPVTYSASYQTRIMKRSYSIINREKKENRLKPGSRGRVGLGAYVFHDQNGLVSRTGTSFSYAYHIYMHRSQLSFGLSGQIFQYKIDRDKLITYSELINNGPDPALEGDLRFVTFIPDASAGVYWTSPSFFLGFSASQLFQSKLKIGSKALGNLKLLRHYYLMGGYRFINDRSEIDLEPSFLIKTTEQLIPQADISLKLYYKSDYWIGASYRSDQAIAVLFGLRADKLYLGYAHDFSLTSIGKYHFGSHEVFVSYKFGSNARRYRWMDRY